MIDELITAVQEGEGYALSGVIVSDGNMAYHLYFPRELPPEGLIEVPDMPEEDWRKFLKEMDDRHVAITDPNTLVKTFVRKCERSILERDKWKIYQQAGYRCEYCYAGGVPLTVDHYMPQEKGGSDEPENLKACCRSCNKKKGNMLPEEWEAYRISKGIGH